MPTENKYDRILAYLKGLLSHRQRHDLEKDMMQDIFEEEAFEGLNQLSGSDLGNDMELLDRKLDTRIMRAGKSRPMVFFRIAAAIVLLIGVGGVLYFVLRTPDSNLLTDEHKIEKPAVRSSPPPAPVQTPVNNEKPGAPVEGNKADIARQKVREPVENRTELKVEMMSQPVEAEENAAVMAPEVSAANEPAKSRSLMKTTAAPEKSRKIFSGTVVDKAGERLPGVVIKEMGTSNGTVSDVNGNFSLPLQDTSSSLSLNFIGYKPVEVEASEKPKDKIVMEEDLVALNEVVVVGYGTSKKSNVTGAVSTIDLNEDDKQRQIDQPVLTKPVPPGGSLRAFKKWVNDRLDYPSYKEYTGKHKLAVELTVHADGSISDIRINESTQDVIAADLKKIISQSPPWKAALRDNNPVESKVEIRFVITVE